MADNYRVAAEYIRDHDGYEYPTGPTADHEFIDQAKALADAYLALVPADDGETIDEEWLRAAGFDADPDFHPAMVRDVCSAGPMSSFVLVVCRDGSVCLSVSDADGESVAELDLPTECQTRGQVRRLCSALGIKLAEPNGR